MVFLSLSLRQTLPLYRKKKNKPRTLHLEFASQTGRWENLDNLDDCWRFGDEDNSSNLELTRVSRSASPITFHPCSGCSLGTYLQVNHSKARKENIVSNVSQSPDPSPPYHMGGGSAQNTKFIQVYSKYNQETYPGFIPLVMLCQTTMSSCLIRTEAQNNDKSTQFTNYNLDLKLYRWEISAFFCVMSFKWAFLLG